VAGPRQGRRRARGGLGACGTGSAPTTPFLEAGTTLAALAATVPRIRIGSLVFGMTYRHPAVLANMAASIDRICGGRFTLGIGAGWQRNEHEQYGIPLPPVGERRMLPLVARGADSWNCWGLPDLVRRKADVLDRHCELIGRDPRSLERTAQAFLTVSRPGDAAPEPPAASSPPAFTGTAGEVAHLVAGYVEAGLDELVVPAFRYGAADQVIDTMDLLMAEVFGPFRS